MAKSLFKDPEKALAMLAKHLAAPDQELLRDETIKKSLLRDLTEAYRNGAEGHVIDGLLSMSPDWGFSLKEVRAPVVAWHGKEDVLISLAMGEYLAREIPSCEVRFVDHAGHLVLEVPEVIEEAMELLRTP